MFILVVFDYGVAFLGLFGGLLLSVIWSFRLLGCDFGVFFFLVLLMRYVCCGCFASCSFSGFASGFVVDYEFVGAVFYVLF